MPLIEVPFLRNSYFTGVVPRHDAVSHAPQDLRRAQQWRTLSRRRRTS